jgi:hypothetical protein
MTKLKLFLFMLVAANTAALAIYLCGYLAGANITYWESVALFLGYRVCAFMANRNLELTDLNVQFMSMERILWNVATLAILAVMVLVKLIIS